MFKHSKFYLGVSLFVQAICCFVLFLCMWAKHKNLARALLAVSAASGITGALLISKNEQEERAEMEALYDYSDDLEEAPQGDAPEGKEEKEPPLHIPVDDTASESDFS